MSDAEEADAVNLFQEPADYFKPEPKPTWAAHSLLSGQELKLRLVGYNPLWGHLLWNAGRTLATYLEEHAALLIVNRTVLELGAGAGLPSIVCATSGAAQVVVTDYPDPELIENLDFNISSCSQLREPFRIAAEGYLWGDPIHKVVKHLSTEQRSKGFDILILADLLFNHSEHGKLIRSIQQTLSRSAESRALVFFTPYRPWLLEKDLAFFDLAKNAGFCIEKIFEMVMDKVLFENDPGDELLRRTVFGYELKWHTPDELG